MGVGRTFWMGAAVVAGVVVAGVVGYEVAVRWGTKPGGNGVAAPGEEGEGAERAVPARHVATWETLAQDLESADEKIKKSALEMVAGAHYRKREQLWQAMEAVSDPALKEMMGQKLDEVYEMLATNPPPVSLHVRNANLREVMDALNEEMGTHMRWNSSREGQGSYTVDMDNVPLWEVIEALAPQGAWQLIPFNELTFNPTAVGMRWHKISGPFFMYARTDDISVVTTPPSFMVNFTVLADPRLPVASFRLGEGDGPFGKIAALGPDSAGNRFRAMGGGDVGTGRIEARAVQGGGGHLQLVWLEKPGDTISSLKVKLAVVTYVPAARVTVDAIDEKPRWEGTLGGANLNVRSAVEEPAQSPLVQFTMTCQAEPADVAETVVWQLFNKDGQLRWAQRGTAGIQTSTLREPPGRPYRMTATLMKRVHELSAELEVKDVPLPGR